MLKLLKRAKFTNLVSKVAAEVVVNRMPNASFDEVVNVAQKLLDRYEKSDRIDSDFKFFIGEK